jgi:hypothetical protein
MFAIPGIIALIIFIYARPQEFLEHLRVIPLLYVFFALALFGVVLDLRVRNTRLFATPALRWALALFAWASFTILIRDPNAALSSAMEFAICMALFALIAHAVQSFRALHVVAAVVLSMVLFVCAVGTHQGFADKGCVLVDESNPGDRGSGKYDGRPCINERSCYVGDVEPGAQYYCERIGLFGTTSIGRGRVRYRGVLQDPNELALAGGAGLPLAFAFGQAQKRGSMRYRALATLAFALVAACAVLTASRGGQLVFLAVLAAYFINRVGLAGVLVGGVLALPLLLFGGRGGTDASSSTMERVDCWAEALGMWREHPLLGVGLGRFGEFHYMTAHNSYLLALAELGLPGMLLFGMVLYVSAKTPLVVLRHSATQDPRLTPGATLMRAWAMGLLAAFVGLGIGIFFLSFTYHYVLWIYLGLSGALYSAVRRHDPSFRVRLDWRDYAIVSAACLTIIVVVYAYARYKLGGS